MCDPNDYRHTQYTVNTDVEDILKRIKPVSVLHVQIITELLEKVKLGSIDKSKFETYMIELRRKHKIMLSKPDLLQALLSLGPHHSEYYLEIKELKKYLILKSAKSLSGVLVITVITSPFPENQDGTKQNFSCKYNCHFCPNEPGQPRSYLHDEPSVLRANQNNFDAYLQFIDRAHTLETMGHEVTKIELLVLGGTWSSYPQYYRETYVRDLFYAANIYHDLPKERVRYSLAKEKLINENESLCKIIGLTLETRPDEITRQAIIEFRYLGCTRIQLGLQHTDNAVLKKINRGHSIERAKQAIKMLKDACYKIDVHLMPNLPGSSPAQDDKMLNDILTDPDLQVDQLKIYPTSIVPWTKIAEWYASGEYKPYSYEELLEVLIKFKSHVNPWIRLNRIIRDIPSQYITDNTSTPDMRNNLKVEMTKRSLRCQCIRCREIGPEEVENPQTVVYRYTGSGSKELFISFETPEKRLVGFCRLRLPKENGIFEELHNCALIRELHVYGKLKANYHVPDSTSNTQHHGFGLRLMRKAEEISQEHGFQMIAVISGIGVRNYYRKLGYKLISGPSEMMVKYIVRDWYLCTCLYLIAFN